MNAALFLELVDAVSRTSGPAELALVADRVAETPAHPLERRLLDRAIRARSEAFALHGVATADLSADSPTPLLAGR